MATRKRAGLPVWEMTLVLLIVAAGAWSSTLSEYYLSVDQIFGSTRFFIIPGLMALGLAMVVSTGEIDISGLEVQNHVRQLGYLNGELFERLVPLLAWYYLQEDAEPGAYNN